MNIYITEIKSSLTSSWLKLGVISLIAAGLFSLLLVLSRTPGVQDIIPWIDFFRTALVVHVNLSVLYWFMSFSCIFWSIYSAGRFLVLEKIALSLCIIGTVIIITAPFLGVGDPLINNYIPVLQHSIFLWGIGLFTLGVLIQCLRTLAIKPNMADTVKLAPYIAAVFTLSASLNFDKWRSP